MRKNKLIILASAVLLIISLTAFYFVMNTYSTSGRTADSSVTNGLQLSLTLSAKTTTYTQGQNINVTLALTNVSHQALKLSFVSSNSYFEFDVYDNKSNLVIAQENEGGLNSTVTLAPERSITENFNWLTAYRNDVAAVGVYQFVGFIFTEPNSKSVFQTVPLNVTIVK